MLSERITKVKIAFFICATFLLTGGKTVNSAIQEVVCACPSAPSARYELTTANDGNRALEKLEATPSEFDVIIVDQKMPQLTGLELVQGIRERGILAKIMVLSAHLSPAIREAYERMDVHMILDKPFDIAKLRVAVNQLAA